MTPFSVKAGFAKKGGVEMREIFREFHPAALIGAAAGLIAGLVIVVMGFIYSPLYGGICLIILFAIVYPIYRTALSPTIKRVTLQKSGVQAEAVILEVTDTHWTVNRIYPVIKLRLEVHPPEGKPFQAETKEVIERMNIPLFQPGAVIPVIYDPKNRKNVSVGTME